MTGEVPERPRMRASRADYGSMAALARAMYEEGAGAREVLALCYGAEFPEEFLMMAEAGPRTLGLTPSYTNQPWKLAIPLDRGGPPASPDSMDRIEQEILARDPRLLPLARLWDRHLKLGDSIVCYHLDELSAGRATIFGIKGADEPVAEAVRYGDSLLAVLHEYYLDNHARIEWEYERPSNRGAGSLDEEDVEQAASYVEKIEELQQRLAAR